MDWYSGCNGRASIPAELQRKSQLPSPVPPRMSDCRLPMHESDNASTLLSPFKNDNGRHTQRRRPVACSYMYGLEPCRPRVLTVRHNLAPTYVQWVRETENRFKTEYRLSSGKTSGLSIRMPKQDWKTNENVSRRYNATETDERNRTRIADKSRFVTLDSTVQHKFNLLDYIPSHFTAVRTPPQALKLTGNCRKATQHIKIVSSFLTSIIPLQLGELCVTDKDEIQT